MKAAGYLLILIILLAAVPAIFYFPSIQSHYYAYRGDQYRADGIFDSAIANYSRAIGANPANDKAYFHRGCTYSRDGDLDSGLADFTKVIALDPSNADALANRGMLRLYREDYTAALEDLNRAVSLSPADDYYHFLLAKLFFMYNDHVKALQHINTAIRINQNAGMNYHLRAIILLEEKKFEESIDDFQKTAELDPGDPTPYFGMALIYMILDRRVLYEKNLETAKSILPREGAAYTEQREFMTRGYQREDVFVDYVGVIRLFAFDIPLMRCFQIREDGTIHEIMVTQALGVVR